MMACIAVIHASSIQLLALLLIFYLFNQFPTVKFASTKNLVYVPVYDLCSTMIYFRALKLFLSEWFLFDEEPDHQEDKGVLE